MTELMRANPELKTPIVGHDTFYKAGILACSSMKALFEHGESILEPGNPSEGFHEFSLGDGSYNVLAVPSGEPEDSITLTALGLFPNVRNYLRDACITLTTKRDLQYSPNPEDIATHVVKMSFFVPSNAENHGLWTAVQGKFEREGTEDSIAKAAFLQGPPSEDLKFNVASAYETIPFRVIG